MTRDLMFFAFMLVLAVAWVTWYSLEAPDLTAFEIFRHEWETK